MPGINQGIIKQWYSFVRMEIIYGSVISLGEGTEDDDEDEPALLFVRRSAAASFSFTTQQLYFTYTK
jgi:hypothetical protein